MTISQFLVLVNTLFFIKTKPDALMRSGFVCGRIKINMIKFFIIIVLVLVFFAILGCAFFFIIGLRDSLFVDIPFVSTRKRAITPVIKALSLSPGSLLYEPGCGSSNILRAAVRSVPGSRGIGTEKGYLPYIFSRINTFRLPISIYYGDLLSTDLSFVTHIYCYLRSDLMEPLSQKILSECEKGTRIVSCDFFLPNLSLMQTIQLDAGDDKLSRILYVYEVK